MDRKPCSFQFFELPLLPAFLFLSCSMDSYPTELDQMRRSRFWTLSTLLSVSVGCQGSLNGLNNPSRVPPPPMGSFQTPSNYTNSQSGGSTAKNPANPSLGQLRAMESGSETQGRFTADHVDSAIVHNNSIQAQGKLADPIQSPRVGLSQFSSAVKQASAHVPVSSAPIPDIVSAAAFQSTPANPGTSANSFAPATGSLSSDAKWRKQ